MSVPKLLAGFNLFVLVTLVVMAAFDPKIKFVFLITDILVYVLCLGVLFYIYYASKREHLRAPWRYILRRPIAMSALIVLLSYVLMGLLDSVHFRVALEKQSDEQEVQYAGEINSALDILLTDLRLQQEKTYSAPFATHLYVKEAIEIDGDQVRDFPRLKYGGVHLVLSDNDIASDIIISAAISFSQALVITLILLMIVVADRVQRDKLQFTAALYFVLSPGSTIPWRAMLLTSLAVIFLFCCVANIGPVYHVLGTDKVGQDVLYLAIKGIRTGLVIGTLTTLVMLPIAVLLGIMAGYYRGKVDDVIQYLYTTLSSIPGVLLIAAAILSLQVYMDNNAELFDTVTERADLRLLFLCIILGITSWTGLCRMLRGETLKLSEMDYIQAANAFGVSKFKILLRHILPNVMHIVLIAIVLDFSGLVLAEAVLAYVGVGVDPTMISWGNMINSARLEMAREPAVWWSLMAAFLFMFTLVLAANLFADAVRDAFDPRLTRSK